jgi:hypothetical protein
MTLLALLALLLQDAGGAEPSRYQLRLTRRDYFLPPPAARVVLFQLDARAAAPKTRLMFTSPLAAGPRHLRFEVTGGRDKTFVIAVPVAPGRSRVEVDITGAGRFDFGFWSGGPADAGPPREYRFTVQAPVRGRSFELDMPAAPAR